jgi:hypothetical protein
MVLLYTMRMFGNRSIYLVKKNKHGRKSLMKTLSAYQLQCQAFRLYNQMKDGSSIDEFMQLYSIASKHKKDFEKLVIDIYLKDSKIRSYSNQFNSVMIALTNRHHKKLDIGFIYVFRIHDRIKIGKTRDIDRRISQYKSHTGVDPEILFLTIVVQHGYYETSLKNKLNRENKKNEWFEINDRERILTELSR